MNNQKSEHLSEQVQLAYNRIRENRAFQGVAPFGYEITGSRYDKRLVVAEDLRLVVADIFRRVIAGESLADICNWLDTLEVKRAKGDIPKVGADRKAVKDAAGERILVYAKGEVTPWWPAMLQRLVRHPAYSGRYYCKHYDKDAGDGQGKVTTYVHECEAIVSTRVQRQAIEALANREKRGAKADPANAAMLRGVILCDRCDDSPMYKANLKTTGRPDSPRRLYYRCWGRGRHDRRRSCGNTVPMDLADATVSKIIAVTFNRPVMRYELIKGHDWEDEIKAVKAEIAMLGELSLSDDEEDARRAELRAERDRLQALPADDDEWREVETDETYAGVYAALPAHERGAWLKSCGFTVRAGKTAVTVCQRNATGTEVTWTEPLSMVTTSG
jgi:Recombinase